MGRSRLKLLPGGQGGHPDDPPGDSSNTPPDYREFLPKGDTLFGILDEANEAAFRAQFPELIPALDQLKKTIHEWQEKFENLLSAAAKELAHALDWRIRIKPMVSEEEDDDEEYDLDDDADDEFASAPCGTGTHLNLDPGETPFKVIMECVENVAFMFERLKEVYDWTQRIPAMLQTIRKEKADAEGRYQKAADAINEQLLEWSLGEDKPSLNLANLEESVKTLRRLPWRRKTFRKGGVKQFTQNIDTLELQGHRVQEASKKEENLNHIQKFLAVQLPDPSNLQTWETMFKDYLDQPPPTPIRPQISPHSSPDAPFSFTHDPVLVAHQKASEAHAAQQGEEERAQRQADLESARQAAEYERACNEVRAKFLREIRSMTPSPITAVLLLVIASLVVVYEKSKKDEALEREEAALEREEDASASLDRARAGLRAELGRDEAEIERLIGEIAKGAVEEGLKNQKAIARFVESGDGTLLYQAIIVAFSERLIGNEWIRMTEMRIDMIPEEERVGPPYLYTLEVKYSVEDKDRGVIYERALLRPHVPFDRIPPASPARRHGKLPVKVGH